MTATVRYWLIVAAIVVILLVFSDQTGLLGSLDSFLRKLGKKQVNQQKVVEAVGKVRALNANESEAVKLLTAEFEKRGDGDLRKLAYILASVDHESNFQPVKERRCAPSQDCYQLQEKYWNTGFFGRGYIQITWKSNYEKFSKILGVDLVADPDKALQPEIAAQIAVLGMLEGKFTGKKLSDYFTSYRADWDNGRRIVNNDRWNFVKIGDLAEKYHQALK